MQALSSYLATTAEIDWQDQELPVAKMELTPAIAANSQYFGHPEWGMSYFEACHRDPAFQARWRQAIGSWQGKIVVDIGCGPGNVYASLMDQAPAEFGTPRLMIGVDVSAGALKMAQKVGYTTLQADAQNLPLVSGFADIVIVNATIHHCDDMEKVITEAARLVRPGGMLITDHDPQRSAWNYQGIALMLWKARLPLYRMMKRGGHATQEEQDLALATEAHHRPGDGMVPDLYQRTLEPMGFEVKLYPHNHSVGVEVFEGNRGTVSRKYYWGQRLSGIDPQTPEAALSLMCVARRQA
jgi:ubiquinone/menaquinone biosynthesis C-methylase UbiE